jgi:predicted  nucleic acid-binding Zn-ribbon protein
MLMQIIDDYADEVVEARADRADSAYWVVKARETRETIQREIDRLQFRIERLETDYERLRRETQN